MTTQNETEAKKKPDYIVKYELTRRGEKKRLVPIGVAFRHKDDGFTIFFNAKPLDGFGDKLVVFPLDADEVADDA